MAAKKKAKPEPRAEVVLSDEARERIDEGYEIAAGGGGGEPWQEGQIVAGKLVEIADSSFEQDDGSLAKLVTIQTASGPRTFRCPAVLLARLATINEGDDLHLECLGKVKTRAGRNAWNFAVLVKRHKAAKKVQPTKRVKSTSRKGR